MKKIICVILATLMLFALVGCGGLTTTAETSATPSETAKTATFVINNIDVSRPYGSPEKIFIGLYSEDLDKELFVNEERLSDFSSFYCRYTEGDYVKVTWEEDKTGKVIESSLIFEDVGGDNLARSLWAQGPVFSSFSNLHNFCFETLYKITY